MGILDFTSERQLQNTDVAAAIQQYLDSIPELKAELQILRSSTLEAAPATYDKISELLFAAVHQSLHEQGHAPPAWMSDLIGYNYENNGDARFITKLLVDHATQGPWIIEGPFLDDMCSVLRRENTAATWPQMPSICPDYECPTGFPHLRKWCHASRAANKAPMRPACDVDLHLGIAGVVPLDALQKFSDNGAIRALFDSESKESIELKEVTLRELQSHCDAGASKHLRIRFNSEKDAFHRIRHGFRSILAAIESCQASGSCLFGIPIFRRATVGSEEVPVLSMETLKVEDIERCAGCFQAFEQVYPAGPSSGQRILNTFPFSSWAGLAIEVSWETIRLQPAVLLATLLALRIAARNVWKSLRPIFRLIAPEMIGSNISQTSAEVLHYSSLAVQCISLAIQSSVRDYVFPMNFIFLEGEVHKLTLEGTRGASFISVTRQSLSCLGDMLRGDIMVFGEYDPLSPDRMDIVASLRDILSLWGPGQLTEAPDKSGRDGGSSVLPTFIEAYIGGGVLRPDVSSSSDQEDIPDSNPRALSRFFGLIRTANPERSQSTPHTQWHWSSLETGPSNRPPNGKGQVDLGTKIRIGTPQTGVADQANQAPAPLTLDGPVRENHECPHSKWACDDERRQTPAVQSNLKFLGTHRSYNRLAGHDIGLQGGQYVIPQFMIKYDRMPEVSLKAQLLAGQCTTDFVRVLDDTCGLLVSSCTKVMTRIRLRDLVAFAGPLLYPELFPNLKDTELQASREKLLTALRGREDISKWVEQQQDCNGESLSSSEKLKKLILAILSKLKLTGISPTNEFVVAWLSRSQSARAVRASCTSDPWLFLLKDGEHSATFACVTPACFETQLDHCRNQDDCSFSTGFSDFTLSTQLLPYQDLGNGTQIALVNDGMTLELGKKYFFNSASSRIAAQVERELEDGGYQIKICSGRPEMLVKRIFAKGKMRFLRESSDNGAISCLISAM